MLNLLFYDNQFTAASDAVREEMTWEEFRDLLRNPEIVTTKGSETQYFPGSMKPGSLTKGDASVDKLCLYCLDADAITKEQFDWLMAKILESGYEAIVHSTYSHYAQLQRDGRYRVRVIFPFSREVLASEFRIIWANLRVFFGNIADQTTSAPSKHYLVSSSPPDAAALEARIYLEFHGKPIDPDEVKTAFGIEYIAEAEVESFDIGKEHISSGMIREALVRRRRGEDAKFGLALKAAAAKEPYAPDGMREATLFGMAGILAKEFPRGNPDDICEPFRFSIEQEEKNNGPKFSEFRDKLVRRQHDILRRAAIKQLTVARDSAKIALARYSVDEYTPENLNEYLTIAQIAIKDLAKQLILVHQHGYYVFNGRGYSYAVSTSLLATIREYLLYRAETHLGFEYFYPNEGGDKPPEVKKPDDFVRDHGCVIEQVRYNYLGQSYFDAATRTLWLSEVETPTRLSPERSPKVEAWMRAFCGGNMKSYIDWQLWMSQYPDVSKALVGLVLMGPSGTGKSAFAEGMRVLFGRNPPCSMRNYLSSFNSEVLGNPLVFADESLPEVNGRVPTDLLRTLISSSHHEVNRKNRPIVTLDGFVRVIMAFQTIKKFDFGRGHSREDIEAIEKRFLFVQGHAGAAELFDYEDFIGNHAIAKHALYLAETLERTSSRFGVETMGAGMVISGDPVAMGVLDWLFEYLLAKVAKSAEVAPANKKVAAFINKRRIFVNVTQLRREWEAYAPTKSRFNVTQQAIVEAVRTLSISDKAIRIRMGYGDDSFWEISNDIFRSRVVALDLITPERFELLLDAPHELVFRAKAYQVSAEEKQKRLQALSELGISSSNTSSIEKAGAA